MIPSCLPWNTIGLLFDAIGAFVILGPEYKPIGTFVKKLDIWHQYLILGIESLPEDVDEGSNDGERAGYWKFHGLRYYLNKHTKHNIEPDDIIGVNQFGGNLFCNGRMLERETEMETGGTRMLIMKTVREWIEDDQRQRMYRIGVFLLLFGFSLQLLSSLLTT